MAKMLEHPQDKAFFLSCFELKEDNYVFTKEITKSEEKKLKSLVKVIKSNRKGAVKVIPLIFASAIVGAGIVFFTLFANPILGNMLERGLESIFEAKADVRSFNFSLLRFDVAIRGITVANRDSPMTNLFEMEGIRLNLKPEAVLRGKIYIEEISADNMRFGTPRRTSGALPARPPKEAPPPRPPSPETPPLIDIQNFDATALLNQEFERLNTPRLYDIAIEAYDETLSKWQGQVAETRAQIEELRSMSEPLLAMNFANIRDVETIRSTVQDINNMVTTVQGAANHATGIVSGIEADINMARALEANARSAITDDINHLRSFIDISGGSAFAAIEPFIRDILSDAAGEYIEYGLRALEALEKIKAMSDSKPKEEKPKKEPRVAFRGRNVSFPTASYPAFFLGTLRSDFMHDTWHWLFNINNISSNPDITNRPVSMALALNEEGGNLTRRAAFNGTADFRTNPQDQQRFSANVIGSGFPVSLGDQLSNVGINGFQGNTGFSVLVNGFTDGGFRAGGDVNITHASIVDPSGTIAEAISTAVRQAENINLGIEIINRAEQDNEFNITTNIAELINQAVRQAVQAYAAIAMAQLERALQERIDEYIGDRFGASVEAEQLLALARGDRAIIDQMRGQLDAKRNEVEQRLRGVVDETTQQLRDEAARQAEQAARSLMQGQTPALPQVPALPNLPGLRR
jgi:uncharacterized protein (TIGR03545 family)